MDVKITANKRLVKANQEINVDTANLSRLLTREALKQRDKLFESALRTMAEPPIKGEITKEKLTWRGIKMIHQQIGFDSYSWLEQRGKQISPKFHIGRTIKFD